MIRPMTVAVALLALAGGTIGRSAEVTFTKSPAATRAGNQVTLAFAVSGPTDVQVDVLDKAGKVVRHLAAGLVGERALPPLANGLAQELTWDGTDDAGKPVGNAARVRVALGTKGRLHRIVGWSAQVADGGRGFAGGPDGTLYVVSGGGLYAHRMTTHILAFGRDGRYLRQLFPGPANLPPEKRRGWPHVKRSDGVEVPVLGHLLSRCPYPGALFDNRVLPAVTGDGRLVIVSGAAWGTTLKHPDVRDGRRLLILGADGSVPADWLGPIIAGEDFGGFGNLALSPDDRFAYVAGLCRGQGKQARLCHTVWRVPLDGSGKAEIFLGKMLQPGAGQAGLNDPQGLATDAAGNLYVSDYGNGRVAVFKPDGSYLDEFPVPFPDQVRVSRKSGAVYVMTLFERTKPITDGHYYTPAHNWKPKAVVKFGGLKDKSKRAELANPLKSNYGGGAYLALDDSGHAPVLYVGGLRYGGGPIYRVADQGDRLELAGTPIEQHRPEGEQALDFVGDVAALDTRIFVRMPTFGSPLRDPKTLTYDIETGEPGPPFVPKVAPGGKAENFWNLVYGEATTGRDGRFYVHTTSELLRYEANGDPAPFSAVGSHIIKKAFPFDRHTHTSTLFVTRDGTIYLVARTEGGGQALDDTELAVFRIGSDGKVIDPPPVTIQGARLGGLAVDSKGNFYLGAQVSGGRADRIPEWFRDQLPEDSAHYHPSTAYRNYGAVVKFPPSGGSIKADRDGQLVAYRQGSSQVSLSGRIIARGGLIPGKKDAGCNCGVTRFDIDPYDRLYVPDIHQFCIRVLDGEGREITRFGRYGNMDSRGPGSPVPGPQITFGWPLTVRWHDGTALVADMVNRRVVAVRFEHAASAECAVP